MLALRFICDGGRAVPVPAGFVFVLGSAKPMGVTTAAGTPHHRQVARALGREGFVEEWEYDDGSQTLAIVGWRDFRPVDMTSAERKRRFRKRKYGTGYYGTTGDVHEVRLPCEETPEEIAAMEAYGRELVARLERGESVASLFGLPPREESASEADAPSGENEGVPSAFGPP